MSQFWPFLLFFGYLWALIFSIRRQRTLVREEVKFFCCYLVVGLMAAWWAHERYIAIVYPPCEDCPPEDINLAGMLGVRWHNLVIPYLEAFASLSLLRFLALSILEYRRKRRKIVDAGLAKKATM